MKNDNVPEIRFFGFDREWEHCKLESYAKEYTGGGTPKTNILEYWQGEFPWIQSSDLKQDDVMNVEPVKFITKKGLENSAAKIIPKDSIAIVTRVGIGKLAFIPITYATSQDFLSLSKLNVDSYYAVYSIYDLLHKEINNVQGTSIKGITKADLLDKRLMCPIVRDEQIKIGLFFKRLDNLIKIHLHELDILKKTKEGFLQKMFPKEGEKIPEVRFLGFTSDWEQRKLGEVLFVNSGKDYKYLKKGMIPVYGTGGYMLSVNDKLSDQDAIGIGRKGTINKPQYLKAPFWTVDTLFFMTPKLNINLLFLYALANKINWKQYDESTGVPSLSKITIENIYSTFPSYDEQIIIGNFFHQIDDTICLHQRELELLKETKKAFLQKMFI